MKTIPIQVGFQDYTIWLGSGSRQLLPEVIESLRAAHVIYISDSTVKGLYLDDMAHPEARQVILPDGEGAKTLDAAQEVFARLVQFGLSADELVLVAVGGGVVGDVAAFAASLYGARIVHVPTTLVAMVDMALDGRAGLNHPERADLYHAAALPAAVLIDPDVLATLPDGEIDAGLFAALRHGIGHDPVLLALLDEHLLELRVHRPASLFEAVIRRSLSIKRRLMRYPPAAGLEVLDFGRPIGRGLEAALGLGTLRYGEALLIGVAATVEISVRKKLLTKVVFGRLAETLERLAVPRVWESYDPGRLEHALRWEKKSGGDRLELYLLADVGLPILRSDVDVGEVLFGLGFAREILWEAA